MADRAVRAERRRKEACLVEVDYAWVTERIKEVARRSAAGRIVSVLEGGYALHALGRSVATHIKVLGDL